MSEAVRMMKGDQGAVLVVSWRHRHGIAAAYYGIPFSFVLAYIAATSGMFQAIHRTLMGSFAIAIGYFVAVQLFNSTRMSVGDGKLRIEHGPLPWRGTMLLPLAEVRNMRVDRPGKRLLLRTKQGEEIDVIDGIKADVSDELDRSIVELGIGA